jgi:hypothetical protein
MGFLAKLLGGVLLGVADRLIAWFERGQRDAQNRADGARQAERANREEAKKDAEIRRTVEDRSRTLSDDDLVGRM